MASRTVAKPTLVERKRTASEHFHRAKPIEIHRSGAKVITFIPKAVEHKTTGWRMSGSLTQFNPRVQSDEGVRINLDEDDVEVLAEALRRVGQVMTKDSQGTYVVAEVAEGEGLTAASVHALIDVLTSDAKSLEGLVAEGGLGKLDEVLRHLGRLATLKQAISALEQALARDENHESFYQDWCKRNSWAFGLSYLDADDIRTITREDQVDLLLPRLFGGYRDLVELKTPNAKAIDKVRDFYALSKPASEALGQALHYTSVLQRHAPTHGGLQGASHIRAYRPRAIVVIGRSANWSIEMREAWHMHNCALTDVQLWTFEELLDCGRQAISVLADTRV